MAEDTTQNASTGGNTAPLPDWLKKAQALEKHEERGAVLVKQGDDLVEEKTSTAPELIYKVENSDLESATQAQNQSEPFIQSVTSPQSVTSQPENKNNVLNLAGDAPVPDWLKKAGATTIPQTTAQNQSISQIQGSENQNTAQVENTAQIEIQKTSENPNVSQVEISKTVEQNFLQPEKLPENQEQKIATDLRLEDQPASQSDQNASITQEPISNLNQQTPSADAPLVQENSPVQKDDSVQIQEIKVTQPSSQNFLDVFKSPFLKSAKDLAEKGKKMIEEGKTAGIPQAKKISDLPSDEPSSLSEKKSISSKVSAKVTAEEKKRLIEAEKIYQQGLSTIRDLIAPSSMEIRYDMLRVEGLYAQTFLVYAYPRYLDINWLSPVVNFDVTMDIAQFIYPIDSAAIMAILKKKVAQMQSSIRIAAEKGMVRDPALETALEDAEELRTQIQRGQEKFFQFALYFTLYADDEKKLAKVAKQLESLLGGKLILTKKAELQMEHGFNSSLPLCLDEIEVTRNMNTSPLSTTFPFNSADLTSDEGILYGLNRHNDSLIIFDRFSLENANSVVFAKSGAGKSYCVKLEILRSLMLGTDVIVIDPENEYQALAQTVGGSYLKVSLTSERRINPFDLPAPLRDEELQPGDLLRSNIINLHGLLKIMLGGVTPSEEGILDRALNDVYALKGITMDLLDPSQIPPPTMEDLYDILSTMDGAQGLAQRLQKFTQGTYAGIFNKPTNVDLNSGLMVFSIRDLEDALRPIAMYIILNYIWSRIRGELKRRILVIDEAWNLMQHEDSARFLFGLVKRARKYYLGISCITQDVEDFVKSPYGKPIITNSSLQLLLKQAPSAIEILGKVFNLTEGEKYMLLNSGVGQGLFFAGLKHVAIQIIASYSEDKIITTDPEEILRQNAAMKDS